jgi:tetratricopeptide (TPR) repeat protein
MNHIVSKKKIFISTPFSRAAADRLGKFNIPAFKIGSGECNNHFLVDYICKFKKPIIMSTGMNSIKSIEKSVKVIRKHKLPYVLMHCTNIYPTPNKLVRLDCIQELKKFLEFTKDEKVRIYEMVAYHYDYEGEYSRAVEYYELLEELLPATFIERYGASAGDANLKSYNRSKAKEIFLRYTNYDERLAWDQLGYIYFEEQSFQSAIDSWKAALAAARRDKMESYWSSGSVFINIGAAYANLNNTDKMCEYYRIALGSGNEEAQRRYNYQCK